MRTSRAGLLVALAVLVPILVELRTVLAYFDVNLSLTGTAGVGAAVVLVVCCWAYSPEIAATVRALGGRDGSNGDV